jgi:hypothetical protein
MIFKLHSLYSVLKFSIATRIHAGRQEFDSWLGESLECPSLGIRLPGREAGHSTQSSGKVKDACIYTYISPNDFMSWCSIKHRESFTVLFTLELMQSEMAGVL